MQQIRPGVEQLLDGVVIGAAAALDHVASQRPGAARKADERCATLQGVARAAHGIKYIAQALHIGHGQAGHIVFMPHGVGELRAFALLKRQAQPHGIGHRQNVAEQNGGIQRVTLQRLQRGFGRQLRVACQRHETACLCAQGAVFGQVTPGLAHEPNGGVSGGLALAGAQEGVVAQGGKRRSTGFRHESGPLKRGHSHCTPWQPQNGAEAYRCLGFRQRREQPLLPDLVQQFEASNPQYAKINCACTQAYQNELPQALYAAGCDPLQAFIGPE